MDGFDLAWPRNNGDLGDLSLLPIRSLAVSPVLFHTQEDTASQNMARLLPPPALISQRRVVVTGLGAVTPLANGMQASWERLLEGKSGVRRLKPSSKDSDGHSSSKVRLGRGRGVAVASSLCLFPVHCLVGPLWNCGVF